MRPANWTVLSMAKAEQAASAAARANTEQALLARIYGSGDVVVDSHAGGFGAADIVQTAEKLHALDGAGFAGVCSYPALIFDREEHIVVQRPT